MQRKPKPIHVSCPRCAGSGRVALSPEINEAYVLLCKAQLTASDLMSRTGFRASLSAMSNRLERLIALGLAHRHMKGNFVSYHKR